MLEAVVEVHQAASLDKKMPRLELVRSSPRNTAGAELAVWGHEDRLVQVFRNIIANADVL